MLGLGSCPFRSALQMTSYEELLPVRTPLALKLNKHVGQAVFYAPPDDIIVFCILLLLKP